MQVVCLAHWREQAPRHAALVGAIARRHGVRCVELAEPTAVARDYAGEIPRELRGLSTA